MASFLQDTAVSPPDRDLLLASAFLESYIEPTRALYEINLRQWFDWCATAGVSPLAVERRHVEMWLADAEERQIKASTISNKLNTITGYYRRARQDGYIKDDPCEYLRRPSIPRRTTSQALTRAELLACLDAARDGRWTSALQDHALWCLLGLNGLRVGEALALDVDDVDFRDGYRTLQVHRDSSTKSGPVPLAPRTSKALDKHLGTRSSGPIFRMGQGKRMDQRAANRVIQRIVKKAGIEKHITPRSLRHTFIAIGLDAGVTVQEMADSMGYSDTRMIGYYQNDDESLPKNATHFVSAYVEGA